MKTIRRFYFYLITLISIQVVIWAVVNLLRTIFDTQVLVSAVDWLAGGIAFVAVGVPIFLLHWSIVQRDSGKDEEEATSRIRALFLYALPLATGIPITYAVLAILNRLFNRILNLPITMATIGGSQTDLDNLIAIAANLIVLVYFWRVLQQDWKKQEDHENLQDFRRLHRYIWMLYGLGLLIFGMQQLLRYIFYMPQGFGRAAESGLSDGFALILVGLPIFWFAWRIIQTSLTDTVERTSSFRLVILYILTFLGVGFSLGALGILLAGVFRWLFAVEIWTIRTFVDQHANSLSVMITLGIVWLYFRKHLWLAILQTEDPLKQAHFQRIYNSILSFAGMVVSFLGLLFLLGTIIENIYRFTLGNNTAMLSDAFSFLMIGLPLWILFWQNIQHETLSTEEIGIEARKSIIRKVYLYLALFVTVVGTMISTGWWIYGILKAILDTMPTNFWLNFWMQLRMAVLFAVFLVYHLRVLRMDGRISDQEEGFQKGLATILILQSPQASFGEQIIKQLKGNKFPNPITIANPDQIVAEKDIPISDILVIPASLLLNASEPIHHYLQHYSGKVIVAPHDLENWYWHSSTADQQKTIVMDFVVSIQQLSENRPFRPTSRTSPWMIVTYILAGLFLLLITFILIAALVNLFI